MTTPDIWETRMEILQRIQELSELAMNRARQARQNQLIETWTEGLLNHDQMVQHLNGLNQYPEPTYSDFAIHCQVEFNRTVIQMLTDLDYRKSES